MEAVLELSTLFKDTRGEAESKNQNKKEEKATDTAAKQKQQQREIEMSDEDDDEETMRENTRRRVGEIPTKSNGPDTDGADHVDCIELEPTPPRKAAKAISILKGGEASIGNKAKASSKAPGRWSPSISQRVQCQGSDDENESREGEALAGNLQR